MNCQKNSLDKRIKIGRALALAVLSTFALVFIMASIAEPLEATNAKAGAFTVAQNAMQSRVPVTHTVMATDGNEFTPAVITVTVGDTVEWIRTGGFHNVVSDDLFRLSDQEDGSASNTWDRVSFTFNEVGTFDYYCQPHKELGMVGQIIVVPAAEPEETVTPTTTVIMTATAMPSTTLTITPTKLTPLPSATPVITPTAAMTSTPVMTPTTVITPTTVMTPTETPTGIPTVPTVPAPTTNTLTLTDVVISEVFYQGDVTGQDSAADDWIELQNLGGDTIDVSTWWVCIRGDYSAFADLSIISGDLALSPGEILVLQAPSDLLQESDLALYAGPNGSTPNFGNPDHLIDFIQWGSPINQGRADLAVQKGIWTESAPDVYDFVPVAGAGESAALVNGTGNSSADYVNGVPSQGNSNPAPPEPLFYFLPFVDNNRSSNN